MTTGTESSLPYGTFKGSVAGVLADYDDAGYNPDLSSLAGRMLSLTPTAKWVVWHGDGGPMAHAPLGVRAYVDNAGAIRALPPGAAKPSASMLEPDPAYDGIKLLATEHPQLEPNGWSWGIQWDSGVFPTGIFPLPSGDTVEFTDVLLSAGVAAAVRVEFFKYLDEITGGVDEAEVRAIVEGMDLGSGSGVREVSGPVTLTTPDGPLVQVYATAAATVNGESLIAGDVAVFRLVAGKWEVRILDVDFEWRVVGTAPVAPPEAIEVTAQAPTWADDTGIGGGAWTTPSLIGVTYTPASGTAQPGETVTITARAQAGYTLIGTSSWSHTFPVDPRVPLSTILSANFDVADGNIIDVYPAVETGQRWAEGLYATVSNKRLIPGSNRPKLDLGAFAREVTYTVYAGKSEVWAWATKDADPNPRILIDSNGQLGFNIASVTYNVDGTKNNYTPVGFRPFEADASVDVRVILGHDTAALYVNGEKIIEGTASIPVSNTWLTLLGSAPIDNLRIKGEA